MDWSFMSEILKKIEAIGVVPVVAIDEAKQASALAQALCRGGLPVAEITFRTAAAEDAIRRIHDTVPDILLGAGTVLKCEQVDRAIDAGARFIVAPGLNPAIVERCQEKAVPVIPGVCTPTEIEQGLQLGLDTFKFFPAEAMGGLATLKAISAPYSMVRFMPTGGISTNNLANYLNFQKIIACGGSWMVKGDFIQNGDFDNIETLSREAAAIVQSVKGVS